MKAHHFLFPVLVFIGLAAVGTKPGDQQCINQVQEHSHTPQAVPDMISISYEDTTAPIPVEVEDRIFYKVAYDKTTGSELCIFVFGKPIWQ